MGDNWKHRSAGMRCRACLFFVVKEPEPGPEETKGPMTCSEKGSLGRCRRHAPTLGGWPAVFESDWCGDHKIDADKL